MKSAILLAALLSSCAHSDLYEKGQRVAHFEGDMTGLTYRRYADGKIEMSGNINHSAATIAAGKAGAGDVLAASGLVTVLAP